MAVLGTEKIMEELIAKGYMLSTEANGLEVKDVRGKLIYTFEIVDGVGEWKKVSNNTNPESK